jgi:uncharacterized protein YxjI
MHELLSRNLYLVKEHVGMFKAANNYDIYDPETGSIIMECREPKLGGVTKLLRFTDYKRFTPFDIRLTDTSGRSILRITRGVSLFLSRVKVFDADDLEIGGFKQKLFSLGGAFDVLDQDDRVLCSLKGKWTGWEFKFLAGDTEFARVTKKWAGAGKELFTSADNYVLEISKNVAPASRVRVLIMAAVMCIDMVLKE